MARQITLANVTQPTNQELNNDWDAVNAQTTTTQPNTVVEQTPAALVPNHTKAMSHLQAQATPAAVPTPTVAPAIQLINGDGKYWKTTSLAAFGAVPPLPWSQHWDRFKAQFNLRFEDRQKGERAMDNLMNGKVVQATSVRKFVDQMRDTCQRAGWNDQTQGRDVVRYGLEGERMTAMAGRFPDGWDDFAAAIIKTDEDLQRVKEKKRLAKKGTSSSSNTAPRPRKPDISRYKLSEEERKEYFEQGLCYKCHKKGPISKYCKGERMIYK